MTGIPGTHTHTHTQNRR